jgi:hypothetical protein
MRARPVIGSVGKRPPSQTQREILGGRTDHIPNLVATIEATLTVVDVRQTTQIKVGRLAAPRSGKAQAVLGHADNQAPRDRCHRAYTANNPVHRIPDAPESA